MPTAMEVRAPTEDDLVSAWHMLTRSFNWPRTDEEKWISTIGPLERCRDAVTGRDGDREVAAFSRVRPFGQFFGGRSVPMAGYSPVGVAPDFRGRGLASVITADHYPTLRERGEVIAGLYPATTRLYRSVGFELGAVWTDRRFPIRSLERLSPSVGVDVRRARRDDVSAIKACYAAHAPRRQGWLDRPEVWWNRILDEQWDDRHLYVVDGDRGAIDGYVMYRQAPDPERVFGYQVNVNEVVTDEVDVALALWRLVGSSASMVDTVTVLGPPEHELLFLLREQDLRPRMEIRYMLRVIDAAGAIEARGYPPVSASVSIELTDRHCDWNVGRWQLVIENGVGHLSRGGKGDVTLSVNAFASLYSGYASAFTLARSGMLRGDAGDLAALDAVFSGPTPWLLDFF
jgi:predicted acetyltransferase